MKIVEGLRYSFQEDKDEHGPYFKILDGEARIAYTATKAAALKITRALNREDLRVFAARGQIGATRRFDGLKKNITTGHKRPAPRRRFRSKKRLYGHHG